MAIGHFRLIPVHPRKPASPRHRRTRVLRPLARGIEPLAVAGPAGCGRGGNDLRAQPRIARPHHPLRAVRTWRRKAAVKVLKILAMHPGHKVSRDRLIECLWPGVDQKHGRDRLKVAVYSLRQLLGHGELVEHAEDAYALRAGAVLLDVEMFEWFVTDGIRHARGQRPDLAAASLGDALRLYRGDFLEEDAYEEW